MVIVIAGFFFIIIIINNFRNLIFYSCLTVFDLMYYFNVLGDILQFDTSGSNDRLIRWKFEADVKWCDDLSAQQYWVI